MGGLLTSINARVRLMRAQASKLATAVPAKHPAASKIASAFTHLYRARA